MRRAERLFRLVNEMRTRDVVRAHDLAQVMEVSPSTIYRDIAHLQASGLPIDGEAGVGYVLRAHADLPSVSFTYDQLDALAVGLAFVENTGDQALRAAALEARAKIQASLPQPHERKLADAPFFALQPQNRAPAAVSEVRDAIRGQRVLQISYRRADGTHSARRVHPLLITSIAQGWMFAGWCALRQDFRTFRFDRIIALDVLEEVFEADAARSLTAFFASEDYPAAT